MMTQIDSQTVTYEFLLKKKTEFEIANKKDLVDYVNIVMSQLPFSYYRGKCAPIPLAIFEIWPALSHEEKSVFASALIHTKFTSYQEVITDILHGSPVKSLSDIEEGLDVVKQEDVEFTDIPLTHEAMAKVYRPQVYEHGPFRKDDDDYEEEFEVVRNPTLLSKLRMVIRWLKELRTKYAYRIIDAQWTPMQNMAHHEMEDVKVDNTGVKEQPDHAGNVVLGTTQIPSEDVAAKVAAPYEELATNERISEYPGMTDRYVFHQTYEWSTKHVRNNILAQLALPRDWIKRIDLCRAPSFTPFNVHRYSRFDMEVKIHINSNIFQVGQLIAAWYYLFTPTKIMRAANKPSVFSLVQLPHVKINASVGNEATLYIPYEYFKPYISNKERASYPQALDLGTLFISVLSPLVVPENGNKSCSFSVYIRLVNCKFTGLIDGGLDKLKCGVASHEMEAVVSELSSEVGMMLYKGVKDLIIGDKNCDNPPNITPPQYVVPQTTHTWSIGNGESQPINMLRLSAVKATGRSGIPDNELQLAVPCNVFGMLEPFTWLGDAMDNNKSGWQLWSTGVHPQCDKTQLYCEAAPNSQDEAAYTIPPVSVVSSLYNVWRGTLEYRFDFVAGPYHTGRVLIAYIPGVKPSDYITMDQARNSAHVVHDMSSSLTCTFSVPYIADKVWWNRKYGGAQRNLDYEAPSSLFMYVLNPLVANPNVSNKVEIIPYVRAGRDFEVAIPAQPAIGLAYTRSSAYRSGQMIPLTGYYPYYVGTQGDYEVNAKGFLLRYGPVYQHYTQFAPVLFPKAKVNSAIYFVMDDEQKKSMGSFYLNNDTTVYWPKFLVYWDVDGYIYGLAFSQKEEALAIKVAYSWQTKRSQKELNSILANRKDLNESLSKYSSDSFRGGWTLVQKEVPAKVVEELHDMRQTGVMTFEMERTKTSNELQPVALLPSTNSGSVTYGEKFNDFKDLLRRYSLYAEFTVNLDSKQSHNGALAMFPLHPSGLSLDYNSPSRVWDLHRDGYAPIIASGYRYYRGGMRIRIVFPPGINAMVWVQHKPNTYSDYGNKVLTQKDIKQEDAVRNHGYAYHIQNILINNVIELSVPFYQPGCYGILRPLGSKATQEEQLFQGLGDIIIGVENLSSDIKNVNISVYSSIEDDMSFNVFMGFPPVVFCDEILTPAATFEMDRIRNWVLSPITNSITEASVQVGETVKDVADDKVAAISELTVMSLDKAKQALGDSMLPPIAVNAVSQLLHVLANPTVKTIAIAIGSLILGTLVISMDILTKFYSALQDFLRDNWHHISRERIDGIPNVASFEQEKDHTAALVGLIMSIAAIFVGKTLPKSFTGGVHNFMKNISVASSMTTNIVRLAENCRDVLEHYIKKILHFFFPETREMEILESEIPEIDDWFKEAQFLLDPRIVPRFAYDRSLVDRVYNTTYLGGIYLSRGLNTHAGTGRFVFALYEKLVKLRGDLVEAGNHPDIRFEPWPLYVVGAPGIGKSFVADKVCEELLTTINYKSAGPMKYDINVGAKYWNGVKNEPVLYKDDAFAVSGALLQEEIATTLQICSCSILNPNMAQIEHKDKRINPLIYYCNSNLAFPCLYMGDAKAVYRRRTLVQCRLTEEFQKKYGPRITTDVPLDELKDYKHLEGYIYKDATDSTEGDRAIYRPFKEIVKDLCGRFKLHYEREQVNFQDRMCRLYRFDPNFRMRDTEVRIPDLVDPGTDLKELLRQQKEDAQTVLASLQDPTVQSIYQQCKNKVFEIHSWLSTVSSGLFEVEPSRVKNGCSDVEKHLLHNLTSEECIRVMEAWDLPESVTQSVVDPLIGTMRWYDILPFAFKPIGVDNCVLNFFDLSIIIDEPLDIQYENFAACFWDLKEYGSKAAEAMVNYKNPLLTDDDRVYAFLKTAIKHQYNKQLVLQHRRKELKDVEAALQRTSIGIKSNAVAVSKIFYMYAALSKDICKCMAEYTRLLNSGFHNVRWSSSRECWIVKDRFSLSRKIAVCKCEGSIVGTPLFQQLLGWLYNYRRRVEIERFEVEAYNVEGAIMKAQYLSTLAWQERYRVRCKDWWKDYVAPAFREAVAFVLKYLPYIIAGLLSICYLIKKFSNTSDTNASRSDDSWEYEQSANYYKFDKPRASNTKSRHNTVGRFEQSPHQRSNIHRRIINNFVFIQASWIENNQRRERQARCLMLFERVMLFERHYWEEYKAILHYNPTFQIVFKQGDKQSGVILTWEQLFNNIRWNVVDKQPNSSNFGVTTLPRHVIQFKNILPLIATKSQHSNVGTRCDMYSLTSPDMYDMPIQIRDQYLISDVASASSDVLMKTNYTYLHRGKGLCGSILVAPDLNGGNGAIIGMHVAGNSMSGVGISEPLYREVFESLFEHSTALTKDVVDMPLLDLEEAEVELDTNLMMYGCVPPKFAHHESGKSKIVPSPLAGVVYEVRTEVNPLKPDDPRQPPGSHPLRDGCNKHGSGNVKPFEVELLRIASDGLCDELIQQIEPIRQRIKPLTSQQAICGDVNVAYFSPLNWKSSEGFPLSTLRPKTAHDKRWLFDLEEHKDGYILKGMQNCLKQQLALRDKCFAEKMKPPTIYTDCLKDYRLPPQKCKIPGKTRIFSIAPIAVTIDCRKYLGDFLASFKNCRIKNMCGIGINPDSLEWTDLVCYLHEVGNNIITLDYSNYGPTLMSQLVVEAIDIIVRWHSYYGASEEHIKRVRWILENDLLNPVHLCGNVVYQTHNGISSGSPLTGELNSIPNMLYIIMAWLKIMKVSAPNLGSFEAFIENCRLVVYGDDLILSVSDKVKGIFNAVSISNTLQNHGIILTSAAKDDKMVEYSCITKNTFLKRGFSKHPTRIGVWLAPVATDSIEESVNWVHECNDINDACVQNCEISLQLAYGQGKAYYNNHAFKLKKACNMLGKILRVKSWDELDKHIFDEGGCILEFTHNSLPWVLNNDIYGGGV